MEDSKHSGQGRPKAEEVSAQFLESLKSHLFHDTFSTSEGVLKPIVKEITEKIQNYLDVNYWDDEVRNLVGTKLQDAESSGEILNTRTLKRFLEEAKASESTINILKALLIIFEKEDQSFSRVEGLYYVFAIHNRDSGTFQESVVWLRKNGDNRIKFMNRVYEIEEKQLKAERLGKHNLLLTLQESDFPLMLYLYLGEGKIELYPFYQAAYIYSDREGNAIANLTVFQRILDVKKLGYKDEEEFLNSYQPKRQMPELLDDKSDIVLSYPKLTVRKNIQYFLVQHTRPLATKLENKTPFDFRKSVAVYPGFHFKPAPHYTQNQRFEGDYFVYFNERFPSKYSEDKLIDKNDFFSIVGKGVLKIWADEISGAFKCELRTLKREGDTLCHKGEMVNDQLDNSDYLILSMYTQPDNQRYVNLLLRVINDNTLIGSYNIAYTPPGQLGSGTVIVVRQKKESTEVKESQKVESESGWIMPDAIIPSTHETEDILEKAIVNFLSRDRQAITIPVSYGKLKPLHQDFRYQGIYRMYSHRVKGGYRKSVLVISRNRAVKLIVDEGYRIFGEVEHRGNALNITMRYADKPAAGFYCIRVDGVAPRVNHSLYPGTFAGIHPVGDERPVALMFVLEFMGIGRDVENQLLKALEEAKEPPVIPEKVKKVLDSMNPIILKENFFSFKDVK